MTANDSPHPKGDRDPLSDVITTGGYDAARGWANVLDALLLDNQSQSTDPDRWRYWQQKRDLLRAELDNTNPNEPAQVARFLEGLQETHRSLLAE
ncbi:MAG: hypothetical protein ACFCVK_24825 [Acidimicrobiales bacterium]